MKETIKVFILRRIEQFILKHYSVNVINNPQYLTKNGKYCHRNYLCSEASQAILELIKDYSK